MRKNQQQEQQNNSNKRKNINITTITKAATTTLTATDMKYTQSSTSSAWIFAWPKFHLMWLLVCVTSSLIVVIDANSRLQRMPFYYGKRTLGYVHHLHHHHQHESEPPASDQGRQLISSSSRNERHQQPNPFLTGRTSYINTRFINGMGNPPTGALRDAKEVFFNGPLAGRVGPPPLMKPETRRVDSSINHSSLDASKVGGIQFDDDDDEEVKLKLGSPEVRELVETNVVDPQAITDDEPPKDKQIEDRRRLKSFLSLIGTSVISSPPIKRKELVGNSYFDDEGRSTKVKNSGGDGSSNGRGGGQDSDDNNNNLFLNPLDMSYPLNHLFGTVMFNVLLFKHRANKGDGLRDLVRSRIEMERRNAGWRKSRFRSTLARMPQFYGKRSQR